MAEEVTPPAEPEEPGDWDRLQKMLDDHHERTVKSVIEHFSKQEPKKDDEPAKAQSEHKDEPKQESPKEPARRHAERRIRFLYGR